MRIIPVVLILLFAFLGACQRDPLEIDESNADAPKPSYLALTDTVRWFLSTDEGCAPRIEFLKDLSDSLALYGVHAEPLPGQEYRFGFNGEEYVDWMRCKWENEAAYLHDDSLLLGESFQILETYQGMDEDSRRSRSLAATHIWRASRNCPAACSPSLGTPMTCGTCST